MLRRRLGWLCPRVLPHKMIVGPELRPDVVCEEALGVRADGDAELGGLTNGTAAL